MLIHHFNRVNIEPQLFVADPPVFAGPLWEIELPYAIRCQLVEGFDKVANSLDNSFYHVSYQYEDRYMNYSQLGFYLDAPEEWLFDHENGIPW